MQCMEQNQLILVVYIKKHVAFQKHNGRRHQVSSFGERRVWKLNWVNPFFNLFGSFRLSRFPCRKKMVFFHSMLFKRLIHTNWRLSGKPSLEFRETCEFEERQNTFIYEFHQLWSTEIATWGRKMILSELSSPLKTKTFKLTLWNKKSSQWLQKIMSWKIEKVLERIALPRHSWTTKIQTTITKNKTKKI